MSNLVSAVLIVKNEAHFIERALTSLAWCDEIIVVDAESTDATPKICQEKNRPWSMMMRYHSHPWLGFSAQRNYAMSLAKHDWIFFLDGDEACSPELAKQIRSLLNQPSGPGDFLYRIRRQEYFLKKPIHYSIWNPSLQTRFFNRNAVRFVHEVHEGVESKLPFRSILEPIHHVEDLRIERFLSKLNHYTTLQAKADYEGGLRTYPLRILAAFPAMFLKNYFYYRGYRDGIEGFVISILEGISRTVRHLKIWQHQRLKTYLIFPIFSLLAAGCSISKPCSEGGDISWNPPIVGDKRCSLRKDSKGKPMLEGPFAQEYQTTRTLALEGQFEKGRKNGIWIYYGEDKKIKAMKYFEAGIEKIPPPDVQKQMDLLIIQKNGD